MPRVLMILLLVLAPFAARADTVLMAMDRVIDLTTAWPEDMKAALPGLHPELVAVDLPDPSEVGEDLFALRVPDFDEGVSMVGCLGLDRAAIATVRSGAMGAFGRLLGTQRDVAETVAALPQEAEAALFCMVTIVTAGTVDDDATRATLAKLDNRGLAQTPGIGVACDPTLLPLSHLAGAPDAQTRILSMDVLRSCSGINRDDMLVVYLTAVRMGALA